MSLLSQSKRFLPYVACAIVIGFFGLRVYERIVPKKLPPMLTQVEGMVELTRIEDIPFHTQCDGTGPHDDVS